MAGPWLAYLARACRLDDRALGEMREAGWKHLEHLGEHYEGLTTPRSSSLASRIPRLLSAITTNGCRSSSSQLAHPNNLVFAWAGPYCPAPLGAPVNTGPAPFVNSFKRMCRECFNA